MSDLTRRMVELASVAAALGRTMIDLTSDEAQRLAALLTADDELRAHVRVDRAIHRADVDQGRNEQRTPEDSGLCCLAAHATATPPWTCDCPCHTRDAIPEEP